MEQRILQIEHHEKNVIQMIQIRHDGMEMEKHVMKIVN
jgi:hypothetical protein